MDTCSVCVYLFKKAKGFVEFSETLLMIENHNFSNFTNR